jgi:hypothetical protein
MSKKLNVGFQNVEKVNVDFQNVKKINVDFFLHHANSPTAGGS